MSGTRYERRRGNLLIEVVGVMMACAVIMSILIAVLAAVMRTDRRLAERSDVRRSIDEMCDQLRRDVHAARSVHWDPQVRELRLHAANGGVVNYGEAPQRWERRVLEGDEERLAGAFRMPRNIACSVQVDESLGVTLVRFSWTSTIKPHDPTRAAPSRSEMIAAVGRDWELLYP